MDKYDIEDARRRRQELHQLVSGNGFPMNHFIFQTAIANARRGRAQLALIKLPVYGAALAVVLGAMVTLELGAMAYRAVTS